MTNKTTSAIDLVLSRIGEEFDGECHLSETEARQIADTITRLKAALEAHGEALFVLSDRLRASGVLSASDAVHEAYERVVKTFQTLSSLGGE